ncbi:MAG: S-layer homology domain-containing protein [Clostridiales bacterium]
MKKIAVVLGMMVILIFSSNAFAAGYYDVRTSDWYYQSVTKLSDMKMINGYGNGKFLPLNNITRAEFVTILAKASTDNFTANSSTYGDTTSSHWAYHQVGWAAEKGITTGKENNRFDPEGSITREEMVTMIYRYMGYKGNKPGISVSPYYSDFSTVSQYAQEPVKALFGFGGINGVGNNKFAPQAVAERAHAAQLIYNNLVLNPRQRTTIFAQNFLGWKYVANGTTPEGGFDAAGFAHYVYAQFGVNLTGDEAAMQTQGKEVSKSNLNMGDLLCFGGKIPHIGIYLGNGKFIHAVNPQSGVIITNLSADYYTKNFISGRRLFNF